jgi:hypothetical protein
MFSFSYSPAYIRSRILDGFTRSTFFVDVSNSPTGRFFDFLDGPSFFFEFRDLGIPTRMVEVFENMSIDDFFAFNSLLVFVVLKSDFQVKT